MGQGSWEKVKFNEDVFSYSRFREIDLLDDELLIVLTLGALMRMVGHKWTITRMINKIKKHKMSGMELERKVYEVVSNTFHMAIVWNPRADILINDKKVIIAIYPEEAGIRYAKILTIPLNLMKVH